MDANQELIAIVEITPGLTVSTLMLYGEDTSVTYSVYAVDIPTGSPTLLGGGTIGTLLDFTDYSPTPTDYLLIEVDVTATSGQTIYGGTFFGTGGAPIHRVTPMGFLVNDD